MSRRNADGYTDDDIRRAVEEIFGGDPAAPPRGDPPRETLSTLEIVLFQGAGLPDPEKVKRPRGQLRLL